MVHRPPVAVWSLNHHVVASRPPEFAYRIRSDSRIIRAVFPRTIDGFGMGRDDHVAGRRSGRGTGGYGHFQRDSDTGFGTCAVTPGEYVVKRFAVG
jgi:hypothetical protein